MEKYKNSAKINDSMSIGDERLTLFAGPCAAESYDICMEVGSAVKAICEKLDINYHWTKEEQDCLKNFILKVQLPKDMKIKLFDKLMLAGNNTLIDIMTTKPVTDKLLDCVGEV